MSDLLIRDIDPEMKRRVEERARAHDRNLSDEVKSLIQKGLDGNDVAPRKLGTEMFNLIPPEYRSDDLVFESPDVPSDPPDFS